MRFLGGTDVTDYLDIIVQSGYEEEVCKYIVDFWKSTEEEWDFIDLHCLQEASIAMKVLRRLAFENGYSVDVSLEDVCPKIDLPSSWDDYLGLLNKKERHELRRKTRRIENLSASIIDYTISDPNSLTDGMKMFFSLHRKSRKRSNSCCR